MKRWLKRIAIGLAVLLLAVVGGALLVRAVVQSQTASRTRITERGGIESLEKVTLGGREQAILIRGHDRRNPVLLFLHGGPGGPLMQEARIFGGELEKHFVVVHWDQRGAGKSFSRDIDPSEMTIEQFERDTVELINNLRSRFGAQRVYLVGHSWGSLLGALVAADHPDLLWAYVGAGQVVDIRRAEQISYDYVVRAARKAGDKEALAALARIKPPYKSIDELRVQRPLLWKYLALNRPKDAPAPKQSGVRELLTSPEYSLVDLWRTQQGLFWTLKVMWNELITVNIAEQVQCIDTPVYLFTGRFDYQVPFELVEEWFASLRAPSKQMVWFERSGHDMYLDEPRRFQEALIDRVLPETYGKRFASVCSSGARQ